MRKYAIPFACGLALITAHGAAAQAPPAITTPPQPTATADSGVNCAANAAPLPQGTLPPPGTTTGQAREPLTDKLARSDGVLCPPAGVDPEIHAPTPDAGNTPVIPPPGSPGGNPDVRPK
jgi:hypothetical protein